ncbi:hypothetical protein QTN25_003731 [Entamoeba marina]
MQNSSSKPLKLPKSTTEDSKSSDPKKKAKPQNGAGNSQEYRDNGNGQKLILIDFAKGLGVIVEFENSSRTKKNGEKNTKIKGIKFPDGFNIEDYLNPFQDLRGECIRRIHWINIRNVVNEEFLLNEEKFLFQKRKNGTPLKQSDSVQNKKDKIQEMMCVVRNLQTNTNNSDSSGTLQQTSVNSCSDKPPEIFQDGPTPLMHGYGGNESDPDQQESVIQPFYNSCSNKPPETPQDGHTPLMDGFNPYCSGPGSYCPGCGFIPDDSRF